MKVEIINKVAQSGIVTIDPEEYFPTGEIVSLDMKEWLFHGLILKEADFRQKLEEHTWEIYSGKTVCLICTADAIVPLWAYMLFVTRLKPYAKEISYGSEEAYISQYYKDVLSKIHPEEYAGKRVVIKGCGEKQVPAFAYVELTNLLMPYAKSIMFGEPCSTVPVYKAPKQV